MTKKKRNIPSSVRLNDSVVSMYTSLGERVSALRYSGKTVSDTQLLRSYRNSWIVKKYIDKTADDMLKLKREITGDMDDSLKTQIEDIETSFNVYGIFREALTWASLLGDSLIVAITDCSDDAIIQPLMLEAEEIKKFIVLRKGEYSLGKEVIDDIQSPYFAMPESYQVNIGKNNLTFHHSRCHRIKLGKHSLSEARKFGTSDIQAAHDAIKIFDTAITSTGDTIQEANVDVIFLSGLNNQISAGMESDVIRYARVVKETKSATNILLMDAGDNTSQGRYEQKNAQFGGLADVITKMANVLAGALDRPITVLFGQSASGFNSGEEDNKAYYETISGLQESRLRPMQDFVDQFILDKMASDINAISYEYPSIDTINEAEEATRFAQYAAGFTGMVTEGFVSGELALREMQARGVLTTITEADIALAKEMDKAYGTEENTGAPGWTAQTPAANA